MAGGGRRRLEEDETEDKNEDVDGTRVTLFERAKKPNGESSAASGLELV
jgi:hypothetical protein